MTGDNRILNINGTLEQTELLRMAIRIAFEQDKRIDGTLMPVKYYGIDKRYGMIFKPGEYGNQHGDFKKVGNENGWGPDACERLVLHWLKDGVDGKDAYKEQDWKSRDDLPHGLGNFDYAGWDADPGDYDVSTDRGWRLYVGAWGNVGPFPNVIFAVKPAFIWYGK